MRWGEARELAGMLGILVMLVAVGTGLSSMTDETAEVGQVPEVPEVPAVELPAVTGPYWWAGPADSAEQAPQLPVGEPDGA